MKDKLKLIISQIIYKIKQIDLKHIISQAKESELRRKITKPSGLITLAFVIMVLLLLKSQHDVNSLKKTLKSVTEQSQGGYNNPIAKSFSKAGATECLARINQVSDFIGSGGSAGAFLFVPPYDINKNILSNSTEIIDGNGKFAYASASFAPNQEKGCEAVYDAVTWWPGDCNKVAEAQFKNLKILGVLRKNIKMLDLGGTTRVFLMPTKDGCISIKKEMIF